MTGARCPKGGLLGLRLERQAQALQGFWNPSTDGWESTWGGLTEGCSAVFLFRLRPPVPGRSSPGKGSFGYKFTGSRYTLSLLFKLHKQVTLIKTLSVQAPEPQDPVCLADVAFTGKGDNTAASAHGSNPLLAPL